MAVEGYRRDVSRTDKVHILVNAVSDRCKRQVKGIQKPISKNNWNSSDSTNRFIDLKRDINEYKFDGMLLSDSDSDDAWTKRTACKAIFKNGGVITVYYRTDTLTGIIVDWDIRDESERSDRNATKPEKLPISFTLQIGTNI